jgi:hypothetical protein
MGRINFFNEHYLMYKIGYIEDEDFGLGEFYTDNYINDMMAIICDSIELIDKDDLKDIDDFYHQHSSKLAPKYGLSFAKFINKKKWVDRINDFTLEQIKDDLDLVLLIEAGRISKDDLINRATELEWVLILIRFAFIIHDIGINGIDLINLIATFKDKSFAKIFTETLEYFIKEHPSKIPNWSNDDALVLWLALR